MARFPFRGWTVVSLALLSLPVAARELTFDERVRAEEAIARVYYRHQEEATRPFEEAVPRAVLERRVERTLGRSAALAERFGRPVTAPMLAAELARIARATRFPERLREIYAALGDDTVLLQECLARPVLVERLLRDAVATDRELQREPREEAEALRAALRSGELDPARPHPRKVRPRAPRDPFPWRNAAENRVDERPRGPFLVGRLREGPESFSLTVTFPDADGAPAITYAVPKRSAEAWWNEAGSEFEAATVPTVAKALAAPPAPESTACHPDDTWRPTVGGSPSGRSGHTAVWTGTEMIIFGGNRLNTGGRYDPLTDTWHATSLVGAPFTSAATAVWTGTKMLLWEGGGGAIYDPQDDTWALMSPVGAPPSRTGRVVMVWTGGEMILFGGGVLEGGRYDPATDSWTPMSTGGAPLVSEAVAGWTGSELIVYGGPGKGGRYTPATDSWAPIATAGQHPAVDLFTGTWTGSELLVWGGWGVGYVWGGNAYDPATDTWAPFGGGAAGGATAVWTGQEMIVFGGDTNLDDCGLFDVAWRYDPAAGTWTAGSLAGAPSGRNQHTAVWTGSEMIIWGGNECGGKAGTGGRYDPATDTWTPVAATADPTGRSEAPVVWTGSRMIVWGGGGDHGFTVAWADLYDPLTDAWSRSADNPYGLSSFGDSVVWTGSEMIIWGGNNDSGFQCFQSGSRYDPAADSWQPTTEVGAPSARCYHSAVWIGERMLVWGGYQSYIGSLGDGSAYDPSSDSWSALPSVPAAPRSGHSAVWTGSEMIVWGGGSETELFQDGFRLDPATGMTAAISSAGAPQARYDHTVVWTGHEMIVWGGFGEVNSSPLASGGRYRPLQDAWSGVSLESAPTARTGHTAVWTGDRMVIWGGTVGADLLRSGGRYDPIGDAWQPTTLTSAPSARVEHVAVWTGSDMIVYGGNDPGVDLSSGGLYSLHQEDDRDGDGYSVCAGDCDDLGPAVHPGAAEVCDGLDDDCDGALLPFEDVDADGDGSPLCADCDDADPARFPGNVDACDAVDGDCDGVADGYATTCGVGACVAAGYCSGGVDDCVPGAPSPETCDAVDDDCDGMLPPDESDVDRDGTAACLGDCDDLDPLVGPGHAELNDGADNQCPGEPGAGLVDEISGALHFIDADTLCWPPQPSATEYEVIGSPRADLLDGCDSMRTAGTCVAETEAPPPGMVRHVLVRSIQPNPGSFGAGSAGERAALCGVERICDDGVDDDGDGRTDCDDNDCMLTALCPAPEVSYVDTAADDAPADLLMTWFSELPAGADDYLFLSWQGTGIDFALCLSRADFYRDAYLALASTAGTATSGAWDKWYRDGAGWSGAVSAGHDNWFGDDCVGAASWCPEVSLGGRLPGLAPGEEGLCEAFENISCGDGTWVATARAGGDRLTACGF